MTLDSLAGRIADTNTKLMTDPGARHEGKRVKRIAMKGARDEADVETYGRCAAAQYALIRGFGFARHVRTQVAKTKETWRGDAVYLISAALPRGTRTIDAEVTVRDCGELGIPTV